MSKETKQSPEKDNFPAAKSTPLNMNKSIGDIGGHDMHFTDHSDRDISNDKDASLHPSARTNQRMIQNNED